jgi:hypothetical protein
VYEKPLNVVTEGEVTDPKKVEDMSPEQLEKFIEASKLREQKTQEALKLAEERLAGIKNNNNTNDAANSANNINAGVAPSKVAPSANK